MKTNHKFYQKHLNYYQLKIKKLFKNIYDQKHINILNHKHIILQGNSLGSYVHEMVAQYFESHYSIRFRQINSNSFSTLSAVLAYYYNVPLLEYFLKILLNYTHWEIPPPPGLDLFRTGPYKMYLRRQGDQTIKPNAEFHFKVDHNYDYELSPKGYKETHKWLNDRNQIVYSGNIKRDPHELGLYLFHINEKQKRPVFHMINKFLDKSQDYI